jgi:hypothetical protein
VHEYILWYNEIKDQGATKLPQPHRVPTKSGFDQLKPVQELRHTPPGVNLHPAVTPRKRSLRVNLFFATDSISEKLIWFMRLPPDCLIVIIT